MFQDLDQDSIPDDPLHRLCVRLARAAYANPPDVSAGGSEAIIRPGTEPGQVVIAVRGTMLNGWRLLTNDVILDAAAYPFRTERGWIVHSAFWRGAVPWRGGARGLAPWIAAHKDVLGARSVITTGHSKGVESLQLAALLKGWGFPVRECVLFGAPRAAMGDRFFDDLQHISVTNYEMTGDPVTCVPTILPWRHPFEWERAAEHTIAPKRRVLIQGPTPLTPSEAARRHRIAGYDDALHGRV